MQKMAIAGGIVGAALGYAAGRATPPPVSPPLPPAPSAPLVIVRAGSGLPWDADTRGIALRTCMNHGINELGFKGCNVEQFCACAIDDHVQQGRSFDSFESNALAIVAHAYPSAIKHPCTDVAKTRCGGWRD